MEPKTGGPGEIRTHDLSALQALAIDHSATDPINSSGLFTIPRGVPQNIGSAAGTAYLAFPVEFHH